MNMRVNGNRIATKVINADSPFIFLMVRVVRLARTARVVWSVMVWSIPVA